MNGLQYFAYKTQRHWLMSCMLFSCFISIGIWIL